MVSTIRWLAVGALAGCAGSSTTSQSTGAATTAAAPCDCPAVEELEAALSEAETRVADLEQRLSALEGGADPLAAVCANAIALGRCHTEPACVESGQCVARRVFVSSTAVPGNLGGHAGADAICQGLADAASLGGAWQAWVGTSHQGFGSPLQRFTPYDGPIERLDGVLVAASRADLLDGTLLAPIRLDERGAVHDVAVWTAVRSDGSFDPDAATCGDWSEDGFGGWGGYASYALTGSSDAVDAQWTYGSSATCSDEAHLYCFEN